LAKELSDAIQVIRIDVDKNRALSEALGIVSLPVVQIYKNSELKWTKTGYSDKVTLRNEIDKLK
jgi:thioredoxin 1